VSVGAAVLSVGDELLAGRVLDTNAHYLASVLRAAGFPVRERRTVPDDVAVVAEAIVALRRVAAVVVVTGGLGPTKDDLTRDAVALALGVPLARDPEAAAFLDATYARLGRTPPPGSDVQADLPRGTTAVVNPRGTAPGILLADADGVLFVAPGVPSELVGMVEASLLPLLARRPERRPAPSLRQTTIAGLAEAAVGRLVADLMERGRDPQVGSYPKQGRVVLALESAAEPDEAARRLDADVAEIRRRLGAAFAGEGDVPLNELCAKILLERGTTVAVAESVTGGLVADGLVEVPGVSRVFRAGFAVYANEAKRDVLGVPETLLRDHGAVSEPVARAMAEGARRVAGTDVALAVTGIAGPGGGSPEKPVGTTWFALADAEGVVAHRYVFLGERAAIRRYARERAFDLLRRRLLGLPAP
jgi:nicotinamide-nucleotide amidase